MPGGNRLRRVEDELHALEAEALAMQRQASFGGSAVALNSLIADIRATLFRQNRIEDLLSEAATTVRSRSTPASVQSSLQASPKRGSSTQEETPLPPFALPPTVAEEEPRAPVVAPPTRVAPPSHGMPCTRDAPPTFASTMLEISQMSQAVRRACREIENREDDKLPTPTCVAARTTPTDVEFTPSAVQDRVHAPCAEQQLSVLESIGATRYKPGPGGVEVHVEHVEPRHRWGEEAVKEPLGEPLGASGGHGALVAVSRIEADERIASMQMAVGLAVSSVRSASRAAKHVVDVETPASYRGKALEANAAWLNAALNAAAA